MKVLLTAAALFISVNSFAGIVPRMNCVGSIYDKKLLKIQEVQEDKVLLEYRSGGAAFANVFYGDLKEITFIVIIDKMFPISDLQTVPVTMGIYQAKEGKTLVEKKALIAANGLNTKVEILSGDKTLTLTCSRITNP